MTLRIEDGKRVYEFVAQVDHKKPVLILMECFLQWMKQLVCLDRRITYDEAREASPIVTLLNKWRGKKR